VIYDGFFDAVQDDSGNYDRTYNSGDFTGYFGEIIGSGVCIHNNPDSMLVRYENGSAVVAPGYLFIEGYWLKNDADYSVPLGGSADYAIVAHLNMAGRLIEIIPMEKVTPEVYPDSLVLAYITSDGAVQDTRYNTDICGVIDSAGELSEKVAYAVEYIDTQIEAKIAQAENDIAAQALKLDEKIAEVSAEVEKLAPPPVGTIKFSASQNAGAEWLKCNGDFISEADYPELVAALGKLTPSGDKFQLLSSGQIGPQITNGVLYGGRLWVYSYSTRKLYGVDVRGSGAIKEISVTSSDTSFNNFLPTNTARPLVLSIVPHISGAGAMLFLTQIFADHSYIPTTTANAAEWKKGFLIFSASFTGSESSLIVQMPFLTTSAPAWNTDYTFYFDGGKCVPKVVSFGESGAEIYYCAVGRTYSRSSGFIPHVVALKWQGGEQATFYVTEVAAVYDTCYQRCAYDSKTNKELTSVCYYTSIGSNLNNTINIASTPSGTFNTLGGSKANTAEFRKTYGPCNVSGRDAVLFSFDKNQITRTVLSTNETTTISLSGFPSAARVFVDGASYLWGKDIYMIFVGTGIIFSRTLEEGSFGYLDTTSVLGTITQFGYLDYSQDEGTLYLMGQDTTNTVKVAKIVLNTLYDYANDGAWLPMIASDGVPAYIKATGGSGNKVSMTIKVLDPQNGFNGYASVLFNGEAFIPGTYTREVYENGTFTAGLRINATYNHYFYVEMNGNTIASLHASQKDTKTATFKVSDFISGGITLQGV